MFSKNVLFYYLLDFLHTILPFPLVNPFVPSAPFLYPRKTLENLTVSRCFQGLEKGCIGNKWVKFVEIFWDNIFKFLWTEFYHYENALIQNSQTSVENSLWTPLAVLHNNIFRHRKVAWTLTGRNWPNWTDLLKSNNNELILNR